MTRQKRAVALLLSVAVVFFLLSSPALILIHAGHDCVGEGCEICEMLCVCAERLRQLAIVAVSLMLAAAAAALFCDCAAGSASYHTFHTLVTLKVKLSN